MSGHAGAERAALADALDAAGPASPTLCSGWQTADLVAHLVLREGRPDAAAGIVVRPLAGYTQRVQNTLRDRTSYTALVDRFRSGPPPWSPFRIKPVDTAANTGEFFVHHEDVLRAVPGWSARELDPFLEDELWSRLRRGVKLMFRPSPVGVTLVCTLHQQDGPRRTIVAKPATPQMVTVSGPAGELTLFAFGRGSAAKVELTGDGAAIAKLRAAKLGI